MNWKRLMTYLVGLSTAATTPIVVMQSGWLGNNTPPALPVQSTSPQQAPSPDNDTIHWDETYHSSSEPNEKSTFYRHGKTSTKKPSGQRIGCICMDDKYQTTTGGGACAGHGGVRYWLYQQENGEVVQHPTRRHKEHPQALNDEELAKLSAVAAAKKKQSNDRFFIGPYEALFSLAFCTVIAYLIHQMFKHHDKLSA
jgi:hypothetical protein